MNQDSPKIGLERPPENIPPVEVTKASIHRHNVGKSLSFLSFLYSPVIFCYLLLVASFVFLAAGKGSYAELMLVASTVVFLVSSYIDYRERYAELDVQQRDQHSARFNDSFEKFSLFLMDFLGGLHKQGKPVEPYPPKFETPMNEHTIARLNDLFENSVQQLLAVTAFSEKATVLRDTLFEAMKLVPDFAYKPGEVLRDKDEEADAFAERIFKMAEELLSPGSMAFSVSSQIAFLGDALTTLQDLGHIEQKDIDFMYEKFNQVRDIQA